MRIGISIPSTVSEGDRDTLCEWIRRIDAGPFSRLATGERIASPFLDLMGVLSAAAVLTERVPIQALISLAPLHEPVLLAKQAATVDVLSGGRFTLGVGVGMREYDYALAGKPEVFAKRLSELDARIDVLRSIWAGDYPLPADAPPLGPTPLQPGGPPIFASSLGPKSMQRAARWADGLAGFHMGPDLKEIEAIFDAFRRTWSKAGRCASRICWCAGGRAARQRIRRWSLSKKSHECIVIHTEAERPRRACAGADRDARAGRSRADPAGGSLRASA